MKILIAVDARGLPIAVESCLPRPHAATLAQGLFDFMLTQQVPQRVVGDKAWDSDALDRAFAARGMELIVPRGSGGRPENRTEEGRCSGSVGAGWRKRSRPVTGVSGDYASRGTRGMQAG